VEPYEYDVPPEVKQRVDKTLDNLVKHGIFERDERGRTGFTHSFIEYVHGLYAMGEEDPEKQAIIDSLSEFQFYRYMAIPTFVVIGKMVKEKLAEGIEVDSKQVFDRMFKERSWEHFTEEEEDELHQMSEVVVNHIIVVDQKTKKLGDIYR
jgi:hypothetical protein